MRVFLGEYTVAVEVSPLAGVAVAVEEPLIEVDTVVPCGVMAHLTTNSKARKKYNLNALQIHIKHEALLKHCV